MKQLSLTPLFLENGIWQAHLTADEEPCVKVRYRDQEIVDTELTEMDDGWRLTVPVPNSALSDGVHTFLVVDEATSEKLGDFSIIAGSPVENDLRVEVELLRAELDMLKQAFRRSHSASD
ncbi:hypothetical protein [Ruegeria lacuscaerulensis]|uniref:hypothetical protein n=1 Tax=Ruegeria lacuscaerulensis TaxID=55218 RepID=UPI00147C05B2|nr:hypothetical protein [Ruegeria lacuscaerulensis]